MRSFTKRSAFAVVAVVTSAVLWQSAAPVAADACSEDGVAVLCVNSFKSQDVLSITYRVTQTDGPGGYTLSFADSVTGASTASKTIGPLGYQGTASGTVTTALGHCYNVSLTSTANTSITVGPVC